MEWRCGCGGPNREDARFCNQCGAPRPSEPETAAPPAPPAPSPVAAPDLPARQAVTAAAPAEGVTPPRAPVGVSTVPMAVPAPRAGRSKAPLVIGIVAAVVLLGACLIAIVAAVALPRFMAARDRGRQAKAMVEMQVIAKACRSYAAEKGGYPDTGHNEDSYYSMVDLTDLEGLLAPTYVQALPVKDPWGHPYRYGVSADDEEFVVICSGSDGETTLEAIPKEPVGTHCFEDDIVWENDRFVQAPEGRQRRCGKPR